MKHYLLIIIYPQAPLLLCWLFTIFSAAILKWTTVPNWNYVHIFHYRITFWCYNHCIFPCETLYRFTFQWVFSSFFNIKHISLVYTGGDLLIILGCFACVFYNEECDTCKKQTYLSGGCEPLLPTSVFIYLKIHWCIINVLMILR